MGWINNQALNPTLAHEWKFTWYLKKCLLGGKETFAYVGNLVKKFTIVNKMKPLGSQKMGLKSGQLGVTRFAYS